jgi:hypothetical protein
MVTIKGDENHALVASKRSVVRHLYLVTRTSSPVSRHHYRDK